MNRKQRAVLVAYAVLVLVLGIAWVPWKSSTAPRRAAYQGPVPQTVGADSYAPIFAPPGSRSTLDMARLGSELVVVTLVAGSLVLAFEE